MRRNPSTAEVVPLPLAREVGAKNDNFARISTPLVKGGRATAVAGGFSSGDIKAAHKKALS